MNEEPWLIAESRDTELPILYRVRRALPSGVDVTTYPTLLNIYWAYEGPHGFPTLAVSKQQSAFEDALYRIDAEAIGFLMMVITGSAHKEWIYYIQDPKVFITVFNECLDGHAPYPIELEVNADPEWSTWRKFLADLGEAS
jgi:hypothetical protein